MASKKEPGDLFDGMAEESGDDAQPDDDDEEMAEKDTGEDLKGFIDEGDAGEKTEDQDGGDSSSSEEDLGKLQMEEGDFDLLEDLGIDRAEAKAKDRKRKRAGDDEGPALSRLRKTGGDEEDRAPLADNEEDLEEKLFGAKDDMSDNESLDAGAPKGGIFDETDAESADDFIVRGDAEREASRKKRMQVGDLEISEQQMKEVMDIFGNPDVLEPVDQMPDGTPMPALPLQDSAPALEDEEGLRQALEPGELEKHYATRMDMLIESRNAPERWIQTFSKREEHGLTEWTEEEHTCEAEWIYMEHFFSKGREKVDEQYLPEKQKGAAWKGQWLDHETTVEAILSVLDYLHNKKYEPIFIVTQLFWRYAPVFESADDIWGIAEKDIHWQGIWIMWQEIQKWSAQLSVEDFPPHLREQLNQNDTGKGYAIFEEPEAETKLKDIQAWLSNMSPLNQETTANLGSSRQAAANEQERAIATQEDRILDQVRKNNFHYKLGIVSSFEEATLLIFGITPTNLGDNIEHQMKKHDLDEGQYDQESRKSPDQLCQEHVCEAFPTKDFVMEAITLYLARLIASDTRVRQYVRTKFREYCAVSTSPTEKGKPVAIEAAHNFRRTYRAFHLVNRPLAKFERDELFLDVIMLHKEGLINVEYSMIKKDPSADPSGPQKYKFIMPVHEEADLVKDKRKLSMHSQRKLAMDTSAEGGLAWEWCEKVLRQLQLAAQAHEVPSRMLHAKQAAARANAAFACAQIQFPVHQLCQMLVTDPIYEIMLKTYCRTQMREAAEEHELIVGIQLDRLYIEDTEWNRVRKRIIKRALKNELYPMLWAEVQADLTSKAEAHVGKKCCQALGKKINLRPYIFPPTGHSRWDEKGNEQPPPDFDWDANEDWQIERNMRTKHALSPICAIIYDPPSECWYLALVDHYGDPMEVRIFRDRFWLKPDREFKMLEDRKQLPDVGTHRYALLHRQFQHHAIFMGILERYQPTLIVVGCSFTGAEIAKRGLEQLLGNMPEDNPLAPKVVYGDTSVCRAVAYNQRCCSFGVYADYEAPLSRMAISLARYFQEPLAEVMQLWHEQPEENGLLDLSLHRLQKAFRPSKLAHILMKPILEATAAGGVQINRIRRSLHLQSVLPFVCGLGPRKARMALQSLSEPVKSRQHLAARFNAFIQTGGSKNSVVENCSPFLRLDPDPRETWDIDDVDFFERTRLSDLLRPLVDSLCRTATGKVDEPKDQSSSSSDSDDEEKKKKKPKDNVIAKAVEEDALSAIEKVSVGQWHKTMKDLKLQEDQMIFISEDHNALTNLVQEFIIPELKKPFADKRRHFDPDKEDESTFHMMFRTQPDTFQKCSLVRCCVVKDKEYGEVDPNKKEDERKQQVSVKVMPEGVRGSFRKKNQANDAYLPGCDKKFEKGESVLARIYKISCSYGMMSVVLSVDTASDDWCENFPINAEWDSFYFVPSEQENWTKVALGPTENEKKTVMQALKDKIHRPRNIRHPNYLNVDQDGALNYLQKIPMGTVLFRPSKRYDCLVAHLKVRQTDGDHAVEPTCCFRTFDVKEEGDRGCSIAKQLHIDGVVYHDFDEIIARHMDPIMQNLRDLQEHSHYGLHNGEDIEKSSVRIGLVNFRHQFPTVLHYSLLFHDTFPGHAMLLWCYHKPNPREEFIEVTPHGFNLWTESFTNIKSLIKWFKEVGWRQATKHRLDFKAAWEAKMRKITKERGPNLLEGRRSLEERSIEDQRNRDRAAGTGGLETPAGGLSTPSGRASGTPYQTSGTESPAPDTPVGAPRTPGMGRQYGSYSGGTTYGGDGYVSPAPNTGIAVPSTPNTAFGQAANFSGSQSGSQAPQQSRHVPRTPVGMQHQPQRIPYRYQQPSTPAEIRGGGGVGPQRGGDVPSSPATDDGTQSVFTHVSGRSAHASSAGLNFRSPLGGAPTTPPGFLQRGQVPGMQSPTAVPGMQSPTVPSTPQSPVPNARAVPETPKAVKQQVPMTPPSLGSPR